jgi:hypothetical protein
MSRTGDQQSSKKRSYSNDETGLESTGTGPKRRRLDSATVSDLDLNDLLGNDSGDVDVSSRNPGASIPVSPNASPADLFELFDDGTTAHRSLTPGEVTQLFNDPANNPQQPDKIATILRELVQTCKKLNYTIDQRYAEEERRLRA